LTITASPPPITRPMDGAPVQPEMSVVLPCFNEQETLQTLVDRLRSVLSRIAAALFPAIAAVRWGRRLVGSRSERSDFEAGRPGIANDALAALFGWETHLLKHASLPIGVSLAALWRPNG
jgi:hypothetical protein